ncbi:hypothetical protein FRC02_005063 [Tulasnella sp. 418]|nr:hypothetical protein FRC02_005063 [Tulasnella sp. 418]
MNAGTSDRTLRSHAVASSVTSSNNRRDAESNTKGRTLANGKALRNTMKDKEAQVAMAKAKEAEKAKDEEAKKSKDAMSKLRTMKLPIDAPGRSPSTFMLPPPPPRTPTSASEGSQQHGFFLWVCTTLIIVFSIYWTDMINHRGPPSRSITSTPSVPATPRPTRKTSGTHAISPYPVTRMDTPPSAPQPIPSLTIPRELIPSHTPAPILQPQIIRDHNHVPPPQTPSESVAEDTPRPDKGKSREINIPRTPIAINVSDVQIEVVDYHLFQRDASGAISHARRVLVNSAFIERNTLGVPMCRLSDVLPKVSSLEFPIKDSTVKLYRLGADQRPIALGRGDVVTDPSNNKALAACQALDLHPLELQERRNFSLELRFLLKIKTLVTCHTSPEFLPSPLKRRNPAHLLEESEDEHAKRPRTQTQESHLRSPTPTTQRVQVVDEPTIIPQSHGSDVRHFVTNWNTSVQRHAGNWNSTAPAPGTVASSDADDPEARINVDKPDARIAWLQQQFAINPAHPPGVQKPVRARIALDRWRDVNTALRELS